MEGRKDIYNVMIHKVPLVKTPWAQAQNHDEIIVNGHRLILGAGIAEPGQVLKALVHMIWACGWRQACYNYNTHKIKVGSWWDGPVFTKGTEEQLPDGTVYFVPNETWRSYDSYTDGIHDYLRLLDRPHMKQAKAAFYNPLASVGDFAQALEDSGYWTAKDADESAIFESMARRVLSTLERYGIQLAEKKNQFTQTQAPINRAIQNSSSTARAVGVGFGGAIFIGGLIWWALKQKR